MKFLITGARGQLAREFISYFQEKGYGFAAFPKDELDVSDFEKVYQTIKEIKPDIIINCSAYNQVDLAEKEKHLAYKVNTIGVYNLAISAREIKAKLVHYSTDYVFDGTKTGFYTEEDQPNPLNEYGKSKLFGEFFIQEVLENYLIFRVSWVYGKGTQNFLYKLEEWAKKQEVLKIAVDEFSVPTSTRTIVEVTLKALDEGLTGLSHLTNSGYASRYEWAKEYFKLKGINKLIYPALQADFNLPAKRPKWSVMSNEKISKALGITIRDWREELKSLIR
ncbi:dTDP-4-dehydrorhamnose reductase [Thermodesulfobacterium geofontis OPF15]|uniref:dTDP-4-dehydrorhamnose reductase n=1 Tax=Thermodesulfobacterium geofontis (strain OPF15) TaxID=795359 RepID=F8C3L3_THEGP|nr:dTDP-4-dehydrorhamnose reductase [Thermodesulfobacterium geofontis]AEH22462.1 dTDP-4-dehydrorhamnose reductase [Thermodesulfobacterium geofontis OPF15]